MCIIYLNPCASRLQLQRSTIPLTSVHSYAKERLQDSSGLGTGKFSKKMHVFYETHRDCKLLQVENVIPYIDTSATENSNDLGPVNIVITRGHRGSKYDDLSIWKFQNYDIGTMFQCGPGGVWEKDVS